LLLHRLAAHCSFSTMPLAHTTYLQLIDLAQSDAAIAQLVAGAPLPPPAKYASERYGWFTYRSSQQLQQSLGMAFIKVHAQQLEELKQQLAQLPPQQQGELKRGLDKPHVKCVCCASAHMSRLR
jgi:hypothetical protein